MKIGAQRTNLFDMLPIGRIVDERAEEDAVALDQMPKPVI